ncbi:TetR/AcrR family transcriptional regulator [Nocardioides sp. AN3]
MSETSETEGSPVSPRDRLLDAAIEIAGRDGLEAVSYRSVATRAGMAHGMVRHYFGSREGLLNEAFRRAAQQDASSAMLRADTVESFAESLVSSLNQSWERPVMQFDELVQAIRGVLPMDNVVRQYDDYLGAIGGTLRALSISDPDGDASALLMATLDGIVLQHFIYGSDARTERILALLRQQLRERSGRDEASGRSMPLRSESSD